MLSRFGAVMAAGTLALLVDAADAYAWVAFKEPVHRALVLLHVFGAIIFMGNIIVSAMWMIQAKRSGNVDVLYFASRAVVRADWLFTVPGVLLILGPGLLTVGPWGGFPGASWAELALALFILSGVIWLAVLIRLQKRMVLMSGEAVSSKTGLDEAFYVALRRWMVWGGVATLLPVLSLVLMVYKPKLWG